MRWSTRLTASAQVVGVSSRFACPRNSQLKYSCILPIDICRLIDLPACAFEVWHGRDSLIGAFGNLWLRTRADTSVTYPTLQGPCGFPGICGYPLWLHMNVKGV